MKRNAPATRVGKGRVRNGGRRVEKLGCRRKRGTEGAVQEKTEIRDGVRSGGEEVVRGKAYRNDSDQLGRGQRLSAVSRAHFLLSGRNGTHVGESEKTGSLRGIEMQGPGVGWQESE